MIIDVNLMHAAMIIASMLIFTLAFLYSKEKKKLKKILNEIVTLRRRDITINTGLMGSQGQKINMLEIKKLISESNEVMQTLQDVGSNKAMNIYKELYNTHAKLQEPEIIFKNVYKLRDDINKVKNSNYYVRIIKK